MKSFEHYFEVRFHEADPAGIMFFAHLFTHAHNAYAALMSDAGIPLQQLLKSGNYLFPLVHAEADYHHPLEPEDNIRIQVQSIFAKQSSFSFEYRFFREELCCATLSTTHVTLQKDTHSTTSIPEPLRHYLSDDLS